MERELAWSSGRFELDGDTLASAISEEMNRHNQRQIQLADPVLGREKLYGAFRFDDPDGFARAWRQGWAPARAAMARAS
jgi:transmembrane sensor